MTSRFAYVAKAAAPAAPVTCQKARNLYLEACRCLPFIHRLHKLEEITSLKEMRLIIKDKFRVNSPVTDSRVTDLLIFKGREELETYLFMYKQRHHAITEYIEPYQIKKLLIERKSSNSAFLDSFYEKAYPLVHSKYA
uniref:NADH dehydrogenase [ubiquinone] 1 alpha subcomplex subunit 6 n=1 Tax=Polytomella parva TaxID=51329 RepID=A0A7S0UM40_9CHLO|nr:Chain W, B14 [Polytomella sp. Pringsheim 198.80]7ARD_W Chain W, B14 [Polytomella sp. Pringsheim 198.80]|mmetsp:Transcript_10718/g.19585  ORF Transcript_10718/g.19585 Transcript_10718/m.19585 type:complete len:138 (+) Transcript_10718:31-444(+)|eukprot:CAMPEP_0175066092 /NCGR_PEP_ID=MMETSP0052_2-20121109/16308_1 /TAXON_ID=51329 ORGANISM="Polytomella parva, Strain SAG 63-3" /NCGR_SAMPLE_ID=MMETSP0052_2 /ASSEMBLY_ACC=CAM_ASM_000194 /LENGTH=137 /DNA_ID=CAMNT_0016332739 /DNA_START=31 /DNA_END=444 /DNA_ORIENTATION=+